MPGLPTPPDLSGLSVLERARLPMRDREVEAEGLETYESVRLFIERATAVRPDFAGHQRQCAGRCRDLREAPGDAAGDRACGGPRQGADPRRDPDAPDAPARRARRRLARPPRAPADAPRRNRVELRHPRRGRPPPPGTPVRVPRWHRSRGRGGRVRPGGGARPGRHRRHLRSSHDQSLLRVVEGGEARFQMLESIREFAADLLASHGEAELLRQRFGAWFLALAEQASPLLAGPGPAALARSARVGARQPPGRARPRRRRRGCRDGHRARLRPVALLADARPPVRGARRASTRWRPHRGRDGRRSCAPG